MAATFTNIDYKTQIEKALLIIESQQLIIQTLQLEILQLKKLVFGSRHEKFIAATDQNAPTLFDVTPIAEVITTSTTKVSYEKQPVIYNPTIKAVILFRILCAGKNKL